MIKIALDDFRGFHKQNFVDIRPITLLVGENSAGKSSFLAGVRYAMDFTSALSIPSFNKDPFQLGTFQQIAHNRGGRAGRARSFSIRLRINASTLENEKRQTNKKSELVFTLIFAPSESQAVISRIYVKNKDGVLSNEFTTNGLNIEYSVKNGASYKLETGLGFGDSDSGGLFTLWPIYLRHVVISELAKRNTKGKDIIPEIDTEKIKRICTEVSDCIGGQGEKLEATSAIRTKPLRTYTPGLEIQDGEGSHVPMELAKLYRARNKETWNKIKKSIEDFGHTSEMFKEISVKSFGKSASDPFQIQFSSDGPKTNIVDLGYGTSQVMPILYSTAVSANGTRFLIQQPEVHLHPRAQSALAQFFVQKMQDDDKTFVLETHSDFIVDRIRKAVSDRVLSPNDVSILFFERKRLENTITQIELNEDGEPIKPPNSYRSFFIGEQLHMLGL